MKRLIRWPDLRLSIKGLIVIAVPAAATLVIVCATYVIGSLAAEAEQWVNHTLRVGAEIQRLRYIQAEGTTNLRGYLISGEEVFDKQAGESLAAFDRTRQELSGLTSDNPSQTERLDRLTTLESSRVEGIVSAMARFQWGALARDQLPALLKRNETELLVMETVLNAMEFEEDRLLKIRMHRLDALRTGLRAIIGICLFLGVTGGVVMSILFHSGVTHRIETLQRNVARLVNNGVLEPLPQAHDEIGALSEGMARTAEILRRRTAALENASHGIAEVDAEGRYLNFNPAYRQLTGLGGVLAAPDVAASIHPDDRGAVEQAIARMREDGRAEIEARVVHSGGNVAYMGLTFVPVSENRQGGYFVFLRDINRRKEAEAALVEAKDAAVAGSLAKSEFLAKISHDIRTPLNAILGSADLLSQTPLNSNQAEYVSMFQRNSRRLVVLINDFLDFSKIEAGVVCVDNVPYKVRDTVEEVMATFRESARRKGVELAAEVAGDVPEWELGDSLRVHQVLLNLLGNAIKFTPRGRVEVRVLRIARAEGAQLRFSVSDTGPGMPPADQQRIFTAFVQSGKPDVSARNGCGLGLAICRELVELMGGRIGVNSQEGVGSTFHFSLPLVAARPPSASVAPAVRVPGPRVEGQEATRVLVAEDTEDNRLLLTHYLRGEAVELQFAENGQVAADMIRSGQVFDLILMDLDMPVLDGFGAARAIRAWETERAVAPTPIVGLSAHAMRDAVRECLNAGCSAHVPKPVDKATLINTIRRYHRSRAVASPVPDQVAALVPNYLASKLRQHEEAVTSLAVRDFEPIYRFGHNLKGTGSGYGFPGITAIGAEIEKSAADHDNQRVSEQLEKLRQFLTKDAGAVPVLTAPGD